MAEPAVKKGQSLWKDAWRRLKKNRFAMGGLVVVVVMSLSAVLAHLIIPFQPDYGQPWLRAQPPGFTHPAVPAEIRFDKGAVPAVPETYPGAVARLLREDGVIEYVVNEVAQRDYRINLHRGKVDRIKEGARSVSRVAVEGEGRFLQVIGEESRLGPELHDLVIEPRAPLPPELSTDDPVLLVRVTEPRLPEPERIRVAIEGGRVASIVRGGTEADAVRFDGRYVLSVSKDGEERRLKHYLGTDLDGRDVLSRVIYGGRISLMVGGVATLVSVLVGVLYGAIAGYLSSQRMTVRAVVAVIAAFVLAGVAFKATGGGDDAPAVREGAGVVAEQHGRALGPYGRTGVAIAVFAGTLLAARLTRRWTAWAPLERAVTTTGEFMMRIVDILYGLPYMFLVILLMISFGRDIVILFIALGLLQWLTMARIVRGQVLSLKEKEFVEAAHMCGAGHLGILFRHLIPNTLGVVVVYTTLTVPAVILQESFLAFIGLTVEFQGRTLDSWGALVNEGRKALTNTGGNWWVLLFPSVAMAVTLFSFNFLGDGLRDALDPQLKGRS